MSQVVVKSIAGSPLAQEISAGAHALRADEPASVGGEGSGPSPYELLLSSLGACTAMTLEMYARRKSWPLKKVTVALALERATASEPDRIHREVTLEGELDQ